MSTPARGKLHIGLTGGIGCGKSTAAMLFAEHDAGIIDTDIIAHSLTQATGAAMPAICEAFGDGYIEKDGTLNRNKMRERIFADSGAKRQLEGILHPLILEQVESRLPQLHTNPYIVLVVPLLPESVAFQKLVQRILVVDCEPATQVRRVIGRSQMSESEVRAIIAQQTPRDERLRLADDIIHNDGGVDALAAQVTILHGRYTMMANSN